MVPKSETVLNLKFRQEIIADIKKKKELSKLDDSFVSGKIDEFLEYDSHSRQKQEIIVKLESAPTFKQFSKSKEYSFMSKSIRAELRKIYGVFIRNASERKDIMNKLKITVKKKNAEELIDIHKKLLALHQSTFERIEDYDFIYKKIFLAMNEYYGNTLADAVSNNDFSGTKYVILDLACGLNPLSSIYYRGKIDKYYASDISSEDCNFLKEYFKIAGIKGGAFAADLTKKNSLAGLKKYPADICFLFKALDSIERSKRGITKDLISSIYAKMIVISFPMVSISGNNKIAVAKRDWFEKILADMKLKFEKFNTTNELFYVIKYL